jgi:rod shape-determining protein MreB
MLNDCFVAAKGLEIDIKNTSSMIVDCGAGKTSITTIRGYEIVRNDILDISGKNLDEAIQTYLRSKYNLLIDKKEAERLKINSVDFRKSGAIDTTVRVTGKEKKTGITKDVSVQSAEITGCLKKDIELLVEKIIRHFENLEDSDSEKIKSTGVHLIGGGFKLRGLIDLIAEKVNVSNKSYSLNSDYMKTGLEQIQSDPGDLYERMMY